jgi:hypothetical protein
VLPDQEQQGFVQELRERQMGALEMGPLESGKEDRLNEMELLEREQELLEALSAMEL